MANETTSFSPALLDFLQDLEVDNTREWFEANRDRYEDDVRTPVLMFVEAVRDPLQSRVSKHLTAVSRKQGGSMFRIHRDVRFSNDKSPYKTHVGTFFAHEHGKDQPAPGAYLHLEPGNCFLGCGTYMPPREALQAIRTAMVDDPDAWIAVRDEVLARGWTFGGESLSRAPKGFDKDHPLIEDLNRTSCIVSRPVAEEVVTGPGFVDRFVDEIATATPLLRWLGGALGVPI